MVLQNVKLGGFTKEEIATINSNFATIQQNAVESADIPDVSDCVTDGELATALGTKVDKVTGKNLSTNDYTAEDKAKVDNVGKITFATSDFGAADSNGYVTATLPATTKEPVKVMRNNNETYESVLVDVQKSGTNILIVSEEAFAGYVLTI